MARPTKTKIDYFPLYCDYDEHTEYLVAKFGFEGYGVYISLLKNLYGGNGYYLNWNAKAECIFSRTGNTNTDRIREIVNCLLDEGVFDRDIFEKHSVLTSRQIQENYLYAVSKRKNITIDEHLRLVNSEKTTVNSAKTMINSEETTQRKENKIKENKIKENKTIREGEKRKISVSEETSDNSPAPSPEKAYGEFKNVILTEAEYEELSKRYPDINSSIERLSQYMAASGKQYASHYAALHKWAREDGQTSSVHKSSVSAPICDHNAVQNACNVSPVPSNSSYDIDDFFELALKRSQEKILNKRAPARTDNREFS